MKRFQQSKHALGSDALMTLVLQDGTLPEPIFVYLWDMIAAFEQRFSRFLPDSELSHVNHSVGEETSITPTFAKLLAAAQVLARKTGGLYNPFILPALQRAGYKGSWPHPEESLSQTDYEERSVAHWRDIKVEGETILLPADTALDFGGIGKGYLLDELAEYLSTQNIANYWLSLGGDIICSGYDEPGDSWRIGVQHALDSEVIAHVMNDGRKMAIATSGITKRKGISDGGAWHHIIDPRSGRPADTDILTATVYSDSATEADVIAKALVIAGSEGASEVLESVGLEDALLQLQNDEQHIIVKKIGTIWSV